MNLTTHERPGVYSSYDASTLVRGSGGHKTVGHGLATIPQLPPGSPSP